ncbi:triphosphoribosyl-dephospho-CoA synthase [Granulicella rosea]|uniref:triphosphoribosyl-dephospho-CoA synthase n=1 Tax=Granulicella rosea TaxID=474952 RepID=A0A239EH69_9BACT|nr:triphosphoribosyl-dephospho-CoA synthase [Granulicella rosea]SNS43363.1 triphosphoribosyl-dephospho-CoA synthase [Granulicella rosea]
MQTLEPLPHAVRFQAAPVPCELAALAVQALVDEAELTPKPGLVDRRGSGAHHDLTLDLMLSSARTLRPFFEAMAAAGLHGRVDHVLREELGSLGRDAEAAMLVTTCGVNTHRGAIWALGLLVAATARTGGFDLDEIGGAAAQLAKTPDRQAPWASSHGANVLLRFGATGARGEAIAGFPHARLGLRSLRAARSRGCGERTARLDALLSIMSRLNDTCLLHRGGTATLEAAQTGAQRVLDLGGYETVAGRQAFAALDAVLMQRWASPGGAADLLAATLFLDSLARQWEGD